MIVLLDVDGVILNFKQFYVDTCNRVNKTNFTVADIGNSWECAAGLKLSKEQEDRVWEIINSPGAASNLQPFPEALLAVKSLMEISSVYFVTAPVNSSATWLYDREKQLKQLFGKVKTIHTKHKELVEGNILIDDKYSNCVKWKQRHLNGKVFWWGTENKDEEIECNFTLVHQNDWNEVIRYVSYMNSI